MKTFYAETWTGFSVILLIDKNHTRIEDQYKKNCKKVNGEIIDAFKVNACYSNNRSESLFNSYLTSAVYCYTYTVNPLERHPLPFIHYLRHVFALNLNNLRRIGLIKKP